MITVQRSASLVLLAATLLGGCDGAESRPSETPRPSIPETTAPPRAADPSAVPAGPADPLHLGRTLIEWEDALDSDDVVVARGALEGLALMDAAARGAVVSLYLDTAPTAEGDLFTAARWVLVALGDRVVDGLLTGLDDPRPHVRARVLELFTDLDLSDASRPRIVAGQVDALGDPVADVRTWAYDGLTFGLSDHAGEMDDATRQRLFALLSSDRAETRFMAAETVAQLGPGALPAQARLIELLTDDEVCETAVLALEATGRSGVYGLIAALERSERADVQEGILGALATIGTRAASAAPAVLRLTESDDRLLAIEAVRTLGNLGPGATSSLPRLAVWLRDEDVVLRIAAAESLASLRRTGEDISPAADALCEAVRGDRFSPVRALAAAALAARDVPGPAVLEALVVALEDDDADVRRLAAGSLGWLDIESLGKAGEGIVEALVVCVDDDDTAVRIAAVRALSTLSPLGAPIAEALRSALTDGDSAVRRTALLGLERLPAIDARTRSALLSREQDGDPEVRAHAVRLLAAADTPTPEVMVTLMRLAGDADPGVAAAALGAVAESPGSAPLVAGALTDLRPRVRGAAARALARCAPGDTDNDTDIVVALVPLLVDPVPSVRADVAHALGELSFRRDVVEELLDALLDDAIEVRAAASASLSAFGRPAVPFLVQALSHEDAWVVGGALRALAGIETDAWELADSVPPLLGHIDGDVRTEALRVLARLGAPGREHVETIRQALADPQIGVRVAAAAALIELDGPDPLLADPLAAGLAHDGTRAAAARALIRLGPEAASAAEELGRVLRGPILESERFLLVEALEGLGAAAAPALDALELLLGGDLPDSSVEETDDKWLETRLAALRVAETVGGEEGVRIVWAGLRHEWVEVRRASAAALVRMFGR